MVLTGGFSPGCLPSARRRPAEGFPLCCRGRLRCDPVLWSGLVAAPRSEEELQDRKHRQMDKHETGCLFQQVRFCSSWGTQWWQQSDCSISPYMLFHSWNTCTNKQVQTHTHTISKQNECPTSLSLLPPCWKQTLRSSQVNRSEQISLYTAWIVVFLQRIKCVICTNTELQPGVTV